MSNKYSNVLYNRLADLLNVEKNQFFDIKIQNIKKKLN